MQIEGPDVNAYRPASVGSAHVPHRPAVAHRGTRAQCRLPTEFPQVSQSTSSLATTLRAWLGPSYVLLFDQTGGGNVDVAVSQNEASSQRLLGVRSFTSGFHVLFFLGGGSTAAAPKIPATILGSSPSNDILFIFLILRFARTVPEAPVLVAGQLLSSLTQQFPILVIFGFSRSRRIPSPTS